MKNRKVAAILFVLALFASPLAAQEKKPLPPFIHNSGLLVHPKNPAVVYASFWIYGVYKSEDYGKSWRPVNKGFKNTSVYNLVIHPRDPRILYAGTHAGGVYKTIDGGGSWMEVNKGLTTGTIWDLAIEPQRPQTLYALTSLGLFKTVDGGERWTRLPGELPGPPPDQQMTLFTVPSPFTIYLQNGGLLFRWMGETPASPSAWSPPLLKEVTTIRAKPFAYDANAVAIYAGTGNGLFKTTDGGAHWTLLSTEPKLPSWIVLDPSHSEI
ncbi:MAG TPA: hypothetical protein VI382_04780, partial [Candidatus Manganitrophaceae bacterium]|nr:hypothetical protein [Candidatus Manganitrophaceae bacterium]